MRPLMDGPVIHLVNFPLNGHVMHTQSGRAHDCWCEPTGLQWVKNKHGVWLFVVEHNDYTNLTRDEQLAERAVGLPQHLAWIDRAIDAVFKPPKQLPPHTEKGPDYGSE